MQYAGHMDKEPLVVECYSDVLCVWAYISQVRIDTLCEQFPNDVRVDYRFFPVFGDVAGKMQAQWSDRGGIAEYAKHVAQVAAGFDHIDISPDVWIRNTPTSSLPAHLLLCGIKVLHNDQTQPDPEVLPRVLRRLRQAFFAEGVDISNTHRLLDIAGKTGVNIDALQQCLTDGSAHARFAADLAAATAASIKASPTLTFNEGRQTLSGNVGYRVIEANVRELLANPGDQQSWC
jgi:predicted DsbA family dithiol-disulfide isomerase